MLLQCQLLKPAGLVLAQCPSMRSPALSRVQLQRKLIIVALARIRRMLRLIIVFHDHPNTVPPKPASHMSHVDVQRFGLFPSATWTFSSSDCHQETCAGRARGCYEGSEKARQKRSGSEHTDLEIVEVAAQACPRGWRGVIKARKQHVLGLDLNDRSLRFKPARCLFLSWKKIATRRGRRHWDTSRYSFLHTGPESTLAPFLRQTT